MTPPRERTDEELVREAEDLVLEQLSARDNAIRAARLRFQLELRQIEDQFAPELAARMERVKALRRRRELVTGVAA